MRLLLVEDDARLAAYLGKGLTEAGFVVDGAASGTDGLHLAATGDYDLVVLDLMLPGRDGFSVLAALRAQGASVPVLVLSARNALDDRVRALQGGADDYLVKPFAFAELLVRLQVLLRRGPVREADRIEIEDLVIDVPARRVTRAGRRLDLTAKEFALLHLLAKRRGEVVPRAVIASQVWDINFDTDTNVIDVAIRRLRLKVDDGHEPKLVRTVRGMGYMLDAGDALTR